MRAKRLTRRLILIWILIFVLGAAGSVYLLTNNDPQIMDLPTFYLSAHLVSLYLQPIVLALIFTQILVFRRINLLVGIRQKTTWMTARLFFLTTIYCVSFAIGLLVPYPFSNYPLFKFGNPLFGTALLLFHFFVLLFLTWLLVGAYDSPHPYLLLIMTIIFNLLYHYYIEQTFMLAYTKTIK